ncbi:MAG: M23 family metallopeptidase [Candidatus Stahlbacteria bacterium]|nr:M23 family metallopeptidase [Candidatus Stahlbacteria bacterium]
MKLTIVPHNTSKVREIRIHNAVLILVIVMVAVAFIDRYSRTKNTVAPEELAKSNQATDEEIKVCTQEYNGIANICNRLITLANRYQSVNKEVTAAQVDENVPPTATIDELLTELQSSNIILANVSAKLQEKPEVAKFTPSIAPVEGYIIQTFGKTKYIFTGDERMCQGIDFAAPAGSSVHSTAYGVVKFAGPKQHSGLTVEIEHTGKDFIADREFVTKYSHLSLLKVTTGQVVKRNDIIGFVGTTGKTTGPMLHYEVWVNGEPCDPIEFILTEVNYY